MIHQKITVTGRVQGVSFRYYTQQKARELGLCGFVRNMDNGDVYIEVEGEPELLQKFNAWCEKGPRLARVDNLKIEEAAARDFKEFEILR